MRDRGAEKTQTIVDRIRHLIRVKEVDPGKIICITYTNAAAEEIRERVNDDNYPGQLLIAHRIGHIGTLHRFMLKLLTEHGRELGYAPETLTVFPEEEIKDLLEKIKGKLGFNSLPMKEIMECNRENIYFGYNGPRFFPKADQIWIAFEKELKANNSIDYDGLLSQGFKLLKIPDISEKISGKYQHLLIDEAQDASVIDGQIYDALLIENKLVVGDPDQAIFQFRGGNETWLKQFYETADTQIKLEENFRSITPICFAADTMIGVDPNRIDKRTISQKGQGDRKNEGVYVSSCSVASEEEMYLSDLVRDNRVRFGCKYDDIAVLCRTNEMCRTYREFFEEYGFPVQRKARVARESNPPIFEAGDSGIEILTIHSAKGQEWDCVILPAFESWLFEDKSEDEKELSAERKLAYVAFTRAARRLDITYCDRRRREWVGVQECKPSRFIKEAGLA